MTTKAELIAMMRKLHAALVKLGPTDPASVKAIKAFEKWEKSNA